MDFETWYRDQHPRVVAILTVAAGDVDLAADATDEAFVRAYERWDRVRAMDRPEAWLWTVALNVARRQARRRLRRRVVERAVGGAAVHAPNPADAAVLRPEVWRAVRALSPRQRTAVALRYVLDLPEPEVARIMGVSRGSASATLVAARRTLVSLLAVSTASR
jgi:RNA polymerase sigma factor (sigma-70 family)